MTPHGASVRFPIEPRDVPPTKAARRLHLTLGEFEEKLPALFNRGFPRPDPTTGMFDLKAIDGWMDQRSGLTGATGARDAKQVAYGRIANL